MSQMHLALSPFSTDFLYLLLLGWSHVSKGFPNLQKHSEFSILSSLPFPGDDQDMSQCQGLNLHAIMIGGQCHIPKAHHKYPVIIEVYNEEDPKVKWKQDLTAWRESSTHSNQSLPPQIKAECG